MQHIPENIPKTGIRTARGKRTAPRHSLRHGTFVRRRAECSDHGIRFIGTNP